MNRRKKIFLLFALLISLLLAACGQAQEQPQKELDIFHSDVTAIDFLEGRWTSNRGTFLIPQRSDSSLIVWQTNMNLPSCALYVLRDGTLYGGLPEGGELALLRFERLDDNALQVTDLVNEQTHTLLRETESIDTSRLDNAYVFHSMRHAVPYLSGMWMNEDGNFFTLISDKDGAVSFNSDLPCPQVESIDFYDGIFCGLSSNPDGTATLQALLTFDIQDADHVQVTCHEDGSASVFTRLSRNLDEAMLNADYVFSNNQQAFAFLDGAWGDPADIYFNVTNQGGSLSWKTNLPLDDSFQGYAFADGGLQGIDLDADGNPLMTPIYLFEIHSQDEITIFVCETEESHTLTRAEARMKAEAEAQNEAAASPTP